MHHCRRGEIFSQTLHMGTQESIPEKRVPTHKDQNTSSYISSSQEKSSHGDPYYQDFNSFVGERVPNNQRRNEITSVGSRRIKIPTASLRFVNAVSREYQKPCYQRRITSGIDKWILDTGASMHFTPILAGRCKRSRNYVTWFDLSY